MLDPTRLSWLTAPLCAGLLFACGDPKSNQQTKSIAEAFNYRADPGKNAQEATEAMRKLKEKAEQEREAAIVGAIAKAAAVPASLPADIKGACAEMRAARDNFVQKRLAGDPAELERWGVMKAVELDPAEEGCVALNNLQYAACLTGVFRDVPPSVPRGRSQEMIETCAKKLGVPLPGEASAGGKPPA